MERRVLGLAGLLLLEGTLVRMWIGRRDFWSTWLENREHDYDCGLELIAWKGLIMFEGLRFKGSRNSSYAV